MKESVIKSGSQVILIVFSVVLGLFLSERIEDRKNSQEAAKLMSKLKLELKENKKILDKWLPYHKNLIDSLNILVKDDQFVSDFINDKSRLIEVFYMKSIMGETPSHDAWDIAKSHPLVINFKYEDLFAASKIYNQQEGTYTPLERLMDQFLDSGFNSKEKAKANLIIFTNNLEEMYSRENQLLYFYNEANKIIKYDTPEGGV